MGKDQAERGNSKAGATFDARETNGEGDGEAEGERDKVRRGRGDGERDREGEKTEGTIEGTLGRRGGARSRRGTFRDEGTFPRLTFWCVRILCKSIPSLCLASTVLSHAHFFREFQGLVSAHPMGLLPLLPLGQSPRLPPCERRWSAMQASCFDHILHNPPSPLANGNIWFQIGHIYEQQGLR